MAQRVDDEQRYTESTSLLSELLVDPLNYAKVDSSSTSQCSRCVGQSVLVFVLTALLALGATISAKNLIAQKSEHEQTRISLREQVSKQQEIVSAIEVENAEDLARIALLSSGISSSVTPDLQARQGAELLPVEGSGISVIVSEREGADALERVLDTDLRFVINALWSAGAEGVEVNGIRVGPTTAVRTAGSAVLVNFQPVVAPYEIRAIGEQSELELRLKSGAVGDYLSTLDSKYGIKTSVSKQPTISLRPSSVRGTNLTQIIQQEQQ